MTKELHIKEEQPLWVNLDIRAVRHIASGLMKRNNIAFEKDHNGYDRIPSPIFRSVLHLLGLNLEVGYKNLKDVVIRDKDNYRQGTRTTVITGQIREDYPYKGLYRQRYDKLCDVFTVKDVEKNIVLLETFGLSHYTSILPVEDDL